MKIIIDVDVLFDHHETDTPTKFTMRSRRYNILNIADLKKALDNMPKDIELQNENSELTRSGFIINKVHKTIQTEQVNIWNYQSGFQRKERVSTFKMMTNYDSNTVFYVNFMKSSRKTIHNI